MTERGPILVVGPRRAFAERIAERPGKAQPHGGGRRDRGRAPRTRLAEPLELVVLEVDLPDASGYELCRELHETYGDDLPVIFVAGSRTEPADRVAGLLLGADDYLVKPFDPDELLARVRRSFVVPARPSTQAPVHGATSLTHREQEVLTLLAAGLTQKEIGTDLVISAKTVGTHIQRILAKARRPQPCAGGGARAARRPRGRRASAGG